MKKIQNSDSSIRSILSFYENNSAQIEILNNGELQEFYFPRLPYCAFRNSDAKDEFTENVNRTNAKTKCENLVRSSKILLIVLKIDYWLRTRLGNFFGLLIKYIELWKNYLQLLAVAINVLIIYSYSNELGSRMDKPSIGDLGQADTKLLIRVLGVLNILLAFLVVGVQLALRVPYNIQRFRVREQDAKKRSKDSDIVASSNEAVRAYNKLNSFYGASKMVLTDSLVLYHILYFLFTVLGVAYHPFFFAFCLTYLIVRSAVLINVLRAVYEPRKQIVLTLFLFIIVSYFFSIISYIEFSSEYDDSLPNACYSLWSCMVVTIDQTYKQDGAIGGFLPLPFTTTTDGLDVNWGRVFYDYIFNLIIAVLLIEILSGIIIDKFGELREENEEKMKDAMSECFICGQSREELEKELGYDGFRYHTLFEHNMWDYLFFIGYLKHKRQSIVNDYVELERYVLEKLDKDDNTWMPCYYDYEAEEEEEQQGFKDDDRILLQQILIDLKGIKLTGHSTS